MASIEFNYNRFPSTKLEESHLVTPLGCLVTPFHHQETPQASSRPLACSTCGGVINSHILINRIDRAWTCPFCSNATSFPDEFMVHDMNAPIEKVPIELRHHDHDTIDYVISPDVTEDGRNKNDECIVTYVIDQYQQVDDVARREFECLRDTIAESITKLPLNSRVILITFSDIVQVHQPENWSSIQLSVDTLLKDPDNYENLFMKENALGLISSTILKHTSDKLPQRSTLDHSSILSPPDENLIHYIKTLKPTVTTLSKPFRSTGLAIFVAVSICNSFSKTNSYGKIMTFLSGAPTMNPGKVVSQCETIRSHHDVSTLQASHFVSASKFYKTLGCMCVGYTSKEAYKAIFSTSGKLVDFSVLENSPKFSVDIYSGSLDQVGIYEMRALAQSGGGTVVLSDSFNSPVFLDSLSQNLAKLSGASHLCKLTVISSPGVKVMNLIGSGTELQSSYQSTKLSALHHTRISDTVSEFDSSFKKRNSTNQWFLGHVSCNDSISLFFEVDTAALSINSQPDGSKKDAFIQFQFKFWSVAKRSTILRIVTIKKPFTKALKSSNGFSKTQITSGESNDMSQNGLVEEFNADVWITLLARLLINKIDTTIGYESFETITDVLDNTIIKLLRNFGETGLQLVRSDNPHASFFAGNTVSKALARLPLLSHSLRRNPHLLRVFNSSPDETAYYHNIFSKCNTHFSCIFILPDLYKVVDNNLVKVPLDVRSLRNRSAQVFFVLDCFYHLVIFNQYSSPDDEILLHHSTNNTCDLSRNNSKLFEVLTLVKKTILPHRPIKPQITVTQSGHSQARFFLSRLASDPIPNQVTKEMSSWWNFFASSSKAYSRLPTDVGAEEYYDELIHRVKIFEL